MTITNADDAYTLPMGFGTYKKGTFAGWIEQDTLALMMYLAETPHGYRANLSFDGDKILRERTLNVYFGDTRQQAIKGLATDSGPLLLASLTCISKRLRLTCYIPYGTI